MNARANSAHGDGNTFQLHLITPSDLEEVARFITRISESDVPNPRATERLSRILLDNPARTPDDPLGWLLRTSMGEIVGCLCCAPQKFCLGQTTFTLMMANSFYVDDRHRGSGTSMFLRYLQLGRKYPLFVSSANPTVAEMWRRLGGYPLGNSEDELLSIQRWSPLVTESVYRITRSNLLAQIAGALASPCSRRNQLADIPEGSLVPLNSAREAANLCAEHYSDKLTGCRDLPYLTWRYFSPVDSTTKLFSFRAQGADKPVMVAIRLQNRGYKQQIRAVHVLDIWGEPANAELILAIAAALCRQYREQADVLVFRCLSPAVRKILTEHGFKARAFAAPIAWCIDKHNLLPTREWYFGPADGDMFL